MSSLAQAGSGIRTQALLIYCFSDRQLSMSVHSEEAIDKMPRAGVPRGSPLGPLLYRAGTNQVILYIQQLGWQCIVYADDITLWAAADSLEAAAGIVSTALLCLDAFLGSLGLKLNRSTTQLMAIDRNMPAPATLSIDGQPVGTELRVLG